MNPVRQKANGNSQGYRILRNKKHARLFFTVRMMIEDDLQLEDIRLTYVLVLIVVFPCMLTIIQLLFQQNAHVFYY
jgi:hypothetical protein